MSGEGVRDSTVADGDSADAADEGATTLGDVSAAKVSGGGSFAIGVAAGLRCFPPVAERRVGSYVLLSCLSHAWRTHGASGAPYDLEAALESTKAAGSIAE